MADINYGELEKHILSVSGLRTLDEKTAMLEYDCKDAAEALPIMSKALALFEDDYVSRSMIQEFIVDEQPRPPGKQRAQALRGLRRPGGGPLQLKDYGKTDRPWYFDREAKQRRHGTVFPEERKQVCEFGANLVK